MFSFCEKWQKYDFLGSEKTGMKKTWQILEIFEKRWFFGIWQNRYETIMRIDKKVWQFYEQYVLLLFFLEKTIFSMNFAIFFIVFSYLFFGGPKFSYFFEIEFILFS